MELIGKESSAEQRGLAGRSKKGDEVGSGALRCKENS